MRDLAKKLIDYEPCSKNLENINLQYVAGNVGKVVKKIKKFPHVMGGN